MNVTAAQAAARTGLTERAIYNALADGSLVAHGGRNGITEEAVDRFIVNRQLAAADKVGDVTRFAERVRRHLQQPGGIRGTHAPLDGDMRDVFGPHVVRAAGMRDKRGCRWCWARLAASVYGGLEPQMTDAHRLLLGEPCTEDLKAMREQLRARRRKPDQPTENTPPARTAAAKPKTRTKSGTKACGVPVGVRCECHTSDRPGGPQRARQDKGTALTTTRRKTLTAAIKTAQDRGDRKHAQELRGLLAALGPQAVRTSKSTSGTPRSEPHGCGCQCERHRSQS